MIVTLTKAIYILLRSFMLNILLFIIFYSEKVGI